MTGDTTFVHDIETVLVTADLTLGGASIVDQPEAGSRPSIELRSLTPDAHRGPGAWLSPFTRGELTSRFEVYLPPASYSARLLPPRSDEPAVEWPSIAALLEEEVDLTSDRSIAIDVPRTRVTISAPTEGDDTAEAALFLRRDDIETRIWLSGRETRFTPVSTWLVPGRYEVRYVAGPTADGSPGGARDLGCWDVP